MRFLERPKRGWLRDFRLWLGVAFLLYVLFGFFGVPLILRSQVPGQARSFLGREASLRAASFNPFTLATTLRGFELMDKDGSRLAAFDELFVNLQASGLFRGAWTLREVRLAGPSAVGRILADGRLAVADLLEPKPGAEAPEEPFRMPRVLIRDLRVESGRLTFRDEAVAPAFETSLEPLNLHASDLSTIPERSGDHVVTIGLENGQVRWSGRMSVDPIRFEGKLEVSLTEFRRVADYVAREYPVRMASGPVQLVLPYVVEKVPGGALRAEAHDVGFEVAGLNFRPRDTDEEWLRLGKVELQGGRVRWPEQSAEVELLRISEPAVKAWRAEDGTINWVSFVERLLASFPASEPGATEPATPWKAACAAFEIAGGSVDVEDRTLAPAQKLALTEIAARLENVTSDGSVPVKARLSATLNGSGTFAASGTLGLSPPSADLDLELSGLELAAFQPYASQVARVQLQSGAAGVRGKASYREGGKPLATFEGRATLDRLSLADPDGVPVLSWDGLAVEDIRLTLEPNLARVRTIDIVHPFAQILIDRQGKIGALKLFEEEPAVGTQAAAAPPPAAPPPPTPAAPFPFPFEVGSIALHGGKVDYADESLILPFATKIHSAEGSVKDLSSRGAAGSRLLLEGKVDEYGYTKAEGTLRVFDPYAASEIRVLFRNVEMSRLTPYVAEFAGYSIQSGRLDLEIGYQIRDRVLVGSHKLTATELTLGDKVEGATANLPLRLAVALLKDSQGRIELDVPIEGSVDDPQFAYRKVIWGAVKRILVNVTTAPFRFLGRLMGMEGDDLEYVSFEAGRSTLLLPEQEKLGKLVEGLKSRPGIVLEVGGRFDPASDAAALRRDKLDAAIAARREALGPGAADEGGAVLDRILEDLYAEAFSVEARDALRRKHTPAVPEPTAPAERASKRGAKEPAPPAPPFDAAGYFEELRAALLEAQSAGPEELAALARARGEAIIGALTGEGRIEAGRVTASEVEPVKKKKEGQELVPCELAMPAD